MDWMQTPIPTTENHPLLSASLDPPLPIKGLLLQALVCRLDHVSTSDSFVLVYCLSVQMLISNWLRSLCW